MIGRGEEETSRPDDDNGEVVATARSLQSNRMSFTLGMSEGEKSFMAKAVAEAMTMLQLLSLLPLLPVFVVGDDRPWLGCCFCLATIDLASEFGN